MMTFRQVEAFRHVIKLGSTVLAAQAMHITQPAVSRLLKELEKEVGFDLFRHHKGRLEPYPAALQFCEAVDQGFLGLDWLDNVAGIIRTSSAPVITIGCLPVLSATFLPDVLLKFRAAYPDTGVAIDTTNQQYILQRLKMLQLQAALMMTFPPVAGVESEPFIEAGTLCALPKGHRLTKKSSISARDLAGEEVIGWMPSESLQYDAEIALLAEAGANIRFSIRTHTAHTRYALVAKGLGIALVEPFSAPIWEPHGVVLRPFEPDIRYTYVLAYPSVHAHSREIDGFRQLVLDRGKVYFPRTG